MKLGYIEILQVILTMQPPLCIYFFNVKVLLCLHKGMLIKYLVYVYF